MLRTNPKYQLFKDGGSSQCMRHRNRGVAKPIERLQPLEVRTARKRRGRNAVYEQSLQAGAISQARRPLAHPVHAGLRARQREILQIWQIFRQPGPSIVLHSYREPAVKSWSRKIIKVGGSRVDNLLEGVLEDQGKTARAANVTEQAAAVAGGLN